MFSGLTKSQAKLNLVRLACVLFVSFSACRQASDDNIPDADPNGAVSLFDANAPLEVQAIGHKYHWIFCYAGPDGRFDTADDIQRDERFCVPANHDIRLHVTSRDYVYVLSIPDLGLRQIGVPDLTYLLDFRTPSDGKFTLKTDPMCGFRLLHEDDMGEMQILSSANFQRWLAEHDETND